MPDLPNTGRKAECAWKNASCGIQETQGTILVKDIPTDLIIAVLLAATQAIMNPPRMAELGLSPKEGYTAIISIVLEGVLTPTTRRTR